ADTGAAVYWGPGSPKNWLGRVPGTQTNNRAELYAILNALSCAPAHKTLQIHSDSQLAINSLHHWAPKHASMGWACANGDILDNAAQLIKQRTAPLHLRWVKGHAQNKHNIAVDRMANEGA
ncbi:ribonuclease H-like domain-containing protein, partial [Phellopilus nigrolimitatus]